MKNLNNQHHPHMSRCHRAVVIALAIISAIFSVPFTKTTAQVMLVPDSNSTTTAYSLPNNIFIAPENLKAASIAIYDPSAKQFIYEKNADEIRPIASLVKVLTAIVVRDIIVGFKYPPQTITLNKIIPETKNDRTLVQGERWPTNDLLRFMLITSSNTAANAFATQIIPAESFTSLMNFKAKAFGLNTIKTSSPSGLPDKKIIKGKIVETPTAYGSARDFAKLMAITYEKYPELIAFSASYQASFVSNLNNKKITHIATSTNELLASIPDIIGGKTGLTDASGGNLAIILKDPQQRPIIIVVMGSTAGDRFTDVATLASSTRDFYTVK